LGEKSEAKWSTTTNVTKDTPIMYVEPFDNRDWSKPMKMICHPG